jgi:GTP-binding protein
MLAQFILSAASAADFPHTGLPEVAMVGRSNVGKSTLINTLVKQKIARTSAAPGKTRLVNYYLIDNAFYLVDLPGYGYARGGRESVEAFEQLTQTYFDPSTRDERRIGGVLQLVDSRHPDLPQDTAGYNWLLKQRYDSPVLPVSALKGDGLDEVWKIIRRWNLESKI